MTRQAIWKAKKEVCQRATHPLDLSLGRAASIRTCFAARKQESPLFCDSQRREKHELQEVGRRFNCVEPVLHNQRSTFSHVAGCTLILGLREEPNERE